MADKYLLPCENCSGQIEIETKSAGGQVRCISCGKASSAPSMREICQLPPVEIPVDEAEAKSRSFSSMSMGGRWTFLSGALVLVIGLGLAGFVMSMPKLQSEIPPYQLRAADRQAIDDMSAYEVLAVWDRLIETSKLEEWSEHPLRKNQKIVAQRHRVKMVGLGIAGAGILIMIASFMVGRR